jgi:hypothetical protein
VAKHHIRLELAREPDRPEGDGHDGYDLVLALNPDHRLDVVALTAAPEKTRVRRFVGGETVAIGHLTRDAEGRWIFDFPGDADDETGFRLENEPLVLGEYVSIADPSGVLHPYRVTLTRPLDEA